MGGKINIVYNIQLNKEFHWRIGLYKNYLEELKETGLIDEMTPEDFMQGYGRTFRNIFRLLDLYTYAPTQEKHRAVNTYLKEKASIEDRLV